MAPKTETTAVELDPGEVALVVGEESGSMSVRVVAASDVDTDATDLSAAPEIVLALAMRLLKDPDFHDEVLDWYYEHQDEDDDEEEEEEEEEDGEKEK
ncbi:Translation initiation factor 2B epsilon subunit [Rhodovastum atsumiense]|uniref:Uncharacterized protein n=1 Tax=Rhodovastum atsumiense TaxID=504468 RepID=A0A5M6ISZ1_9PROT|nr:hypothetical protein [Rhodovastum atsumiense]KAA5611019.1 hypothetical protein F1189_16545 [Rhodovastum atsumiense]CAH2600197.1 Translation initiation factor 2B epsilon subunit [Rhodovastum atsumiense]